VALAARRNTMINELKKQLQEQIEGMKQELKERLEPAFKDFNMQIELNDNLDVVTLAAYQTVPGDQGRTTENIIPFAYDRSQKRTLMNTSSRVVIRDNFGQVVALQASALTVSYDLITFVFNTLISFINEKNPVLDTRE
jgi:hypothetical protein